MKKKSIQAVNNESIISTGDADMQLENDQVQVEV
jgi:hypothetical protein